MSGLLYYFDNLWQIHMKKFYVDVTFECQYVSYIRDISKTKTTIIKKDKSWKSIYSLFYFV